MLTKQDLQAIRNLVREEISVAIDASEIRVTNNLTRKIEDAKNEVIKQITKDFGDFMHDTVLPQLDKKADKADIERLERKLDLHITQHHQVRVIS